jgi:hypothetical protein
MCQPEKSRRQNGLAEYGRLKMDDRLLHGLGRSHPTVREDCKHIVIVNAATPVFVGSGEEGGRQGTQATTVKRGIELPV